ncbi:MAG: hypothetical protein HYX87_06610 [Chloroflexi bacterium]|nr:hypothetical protein [Chloroflexota bacterium]
MWTRPRGIGIVSVMALVSLLLASTLLSPGCSKRVTASGDYAIDPGRSITTPFDLRQGDSVKLTIAVKQGDNIGVMLRNPDGSPLLSPQTVGSSEYKLKIKTSGPHSLVLDNTYASAVKLVHVAVEYPQR